MISQKLQEACTLLLTHEPWYGHAAIEIHWLAENSISTMGVRLRADSEIECLYNEEFVASLSIRHLYAVIQHELDHVFLGHLIRRQSFDPKLWNIATDMVINGKRESPRIGYDVSSYGAKALPMDDRIAWIPDDFPPTLNAEHYYKLLLQRLQEMKQIPAGSESKDGKEKARRKTQSSQKSLKSEDYLKPFLEESSAQSNPWQMDHHETWDHKNAPKDGEAMKAAVNSLLKRLGPRSIGKGMGQESGSQQESIDEVKASEVSWKTILRNFIVRSRLRGRRRSTLLRRNRRIDLFGIPGTTRNRKLRASVVMDTSASVSEDEIQMFFGEMERLQSIASFSVLQWDYSYQSYWPEYKKGDFAKITLRGRGGTNMVAPIHWLIKEKKLADCVILFTDGFCNYPQPFGVPMLVVLTSQYSDWPPSWIVSTRLADK